MVHRLERAYVCVCVCVWGVAECGGVSLCWGINGSSVDEEGYRRYIIKDLLE